jgi:hypothetical protein
MLFFARFFKADCICLIKDIFVFQVKKGNEQGVSKRRQVVSDGHR